MRDSVMEWFYFFAGVSLAVLSSLSILLNIVDYVNGMLVMLGGWLFIILSELKAIKRRIDDLYEIEIEFYDMEDDEDDY